MKHLSISTPLKVWTDKSPICAECGGECCKSSPGIYSPGQIEPFTLDRIMQMIRNEQCAVDYWEGDIESSDLYSCIYYVRPAGKGAKRLVDPSWEQECVQLTPNGCKLSTNNRPLQCLALVPVNGMRCKSEPGYSKEDFVRTWRLHQEVMRLVVHEIRNVEISRRQ